MALGMPTTCIMHVAQQHKSTATYNEHFQLHWHTLGSVCAPL